MMHLCCYFDEQLHFAIYTRRVHHRAPVIPNALQPVVLLTKSKVYFNGENVI